MQEAMLQKEPKNVFLHQMEAQTHPEINSQFKQQK